MSAYPLKAEIPQHDWHVRFGSKADILRCELHVRFTPDSDIRRVFSIVCFRPEADIGASRNGVVNIEAQTISPSRSVSSLTALCLTHRIARALFCLCERILLAR